MPFSGKLSKGCLPCRQKRTKCDLAQPSCTQCLRTGRICSGYRNEQDLVFRNQTNFVARKAKRKSEVPREDQAGASSAAVKDLGALMRRTPSRRVNLHEEAICHWFAHFNEKFYASSGELADGFNYVIPVYQSDLARGGPASEIIHACGLAALGNMRGAPDMVVAARTKQVKVLRQLNEQLQDPKFALSNSSMLTVMLLGSFESIVCDGPQSMTAQSAHLRGAAAIARLRGRSQFADNVGHGLYIRMRGSLIASCMRSRDPLPDFIVDFLADEGLTQRDFEPTTYALFVGVCQLRYEHKIRGFIDDVMAEQAQRLFDDFEDWEPSDPDSTWKRGQRPPAEIAAHTSNQDFTYRVVWLATAWLMQRSSQILLTEMLIEYARERQKRQPSTRNETALENVLAQQRRVCDRVQDSVMYYLDNFAQSTAATRTIGAHILMWPLSVLLTTSTCTAETMNWIMRQSSRIADTFSLRQGRMMADLIQMGVRQPQIPSAQYTRSEEQKASAKLPIITHIGPMAREPDLETPEGTLSPDTLSTGTESTRSWMSLKNLE